jgi:hypothetical protein
MATMEAFDKILNWKLQRGSHKFPGKDGGTCINEAALVAAGFEYKPVRWVEEMPGGFSRPICRFAMLLNDSACEKDRQRLLPFVTRLACADTPEIERERATYIRRNLRRGYNRFPFNEGLQVLEGALAIRRQAELFAPDEVKTRMEAIEAKATTPPSVSDIPFFAKLKSWFETKREIEPAS